MTCLGPVRGWLFLGRLGGTSAWTWPFERAWLEWNSMRLAVSWQLGLELVLDVEQAQAGLFSWQTQHVKLAVHSDPERLDVLGVSQKRKTGLASVLNHFKNASPVGPQPKPCNFFAPNRYCYCCYCCHNCGVFFRLGGFSEVRGPLGVK